MPSSIDRPADTEPQEPRRARRGFAPRADRTWCLGALEPATKAHGQVRQPRPTRPVTLADTELRLARRITYGLTQEDVSVVRSAGYEGYLQYQLNPEPIDDGPSNQRLAAYPTINLPTWQLYSLDSGLVTRELVEATMMRAIYSRRQLSERMVEFWTDHFHTNIDDISILKVAEDRDVIRANAWRCFRRCWREREQPGNASILTTRRAPRRTQPELRSRTPELHTLGVDGGTHRLTSLTSHDVLRGAAAATHADGGTFFTTRPVTPAAPSSCSA
jgi:hypothetical protein